MIAKVRALLQKPAHRYIFIGGSVYVLVWVIIVLAPYFGASAVVAVGIAFWCGLVISFVLQKVVTFGDKRLHHRILVPQIVVFSLLVLWNFGFTVLMTNLLVPTLPAAAVRTLALGVTTIWNFYLYKTRIFKTDEDNPVY